VRAVNDLWKPKALYISENGCSADDPVSADGKVYDGDRIMYLRNYLTHLQRAAREGYPIKGYFLWSLMDNFEWEDGYTKLFRHPPRRLQDRQAHPQAERGLVSRTGPHQPAGVMLPCPGRTCPGQGPQR
jgi:beta-glucosidase/6-phospho-beta-glucosidase/beta-galactosidase